MARCRACDIELYGTYVPHLNKNTGQEDDLCGTCKRLSAIDYEERQYIGGENPHEGLTPPRGSGYE